MQHARQVYNGEASQASK